MYCCPPMPPVPCPPPCPPTPSKDDSSKYYREIGTAVIGNQLIIRMEREKGKSKKTSKWDPPCDCEVVEIQRPSSKQGPKILKGADNNRILFRVQSKSHTAVKSGGDDMAQAILYEVAQCKGGPNTNNQCRTFNIYPVMDSSGRQEVHTDRVTEGNENVFMLKVKKKPQSNEEPKSNVELELRTPIPPAPLPPPESEQPPSPQCVQPPQSQTMQPVYTSPCNEEKKPPEEKTKPPKKKKKKKKKKKYC